MESEPYYSLNCYLKNTFSQKVYKLTLSGGMTCPNRDGTCGTGGCIFCGDDGSGAFAEDSRLSITDQLERAKQRVAKKAINAKYIAYFQSFTNTYAEVSYLRQIFLEAIKSEEVVALSIATRPDCLPDKVLDLLTELQKIKPVFVELGLQTIHEKTAQYIRRGYALQCFDAAVKNLKSIGVNVVIHVILGLPGETKEMMLETVRYVGKSGADGIKLQLLHVLRETDLAVDFENGLFKTLTFEEYADILLSCIEILPTHMVIHRLTGDGAKDRLITPLWSTDKKRVLNDISRLIKDKKIIQGSKF